MLQVTYSRVQWNSYSFNFDLTGVLPPDNYRSYLILIDYANGQGTVYGGVYGIICNDYLKIIATSEIGVTSTINFSNDVLTCSFSTHVSACDVTVIKLFN